MSASKAAKDAVGKALPAVRATIGKALRETGTAMKHASGEEIYSTLRPSMTLNNVTPFKTNDTFIAPSASVIGDVTNWDESSVWYGAVVRGDRAAVEIGYQSNIQDRCVVNTVPSPLQSGLPSRCTIGHCVSIGSGSILTSCIVDDLVQIGEKCVIGEGAFVEKEVILEPGTVVPPYARIPSGQRWGGNPATFLGNLEKEEKAAIKGRAEEVGEQAWEHLCEYLPYGNTYQHLEELEKQGVKAIKG